MSDEKSWLDGLVGWDKDFNVIETCFPDDPAVDTVASDVESFKKDNLNKDHLVFKPGKEPVRVVVTLPSPAQFSSIVPHLGNFEDLGDEAALVVCHKLFEMCVRVPDVESFNPEMRDGFRRLPLNVMRSISIEKPQYVTMFGNWLLEKYLLTEEEKK